MGMLDMVQGISKAPHNAFSVLFGKPGSGKTTIAGTYPKPILYVQIGDDGGGEVLGSYSDDEIKMLLLSSDKVGDKNSKSILVKILELLEELKQPNPYKTVVFDTYSAIEESHIKYLEAVKGKKLTLQERGDVGTAMLTLRDKIIENSQHGVEYLALSHIKEKATTDNTTGEETTMIVPKMSYNNGNSLLEKAYNVMYAAKKTVIEEDGTRSVKFLTYIGAHPNMDTKLRMKDKTKLTRGFYIEDFTYDKLKKLMNGESKVEDLKEVNVVEPNNPFEEGSEENDKEEW